MADLVREVGTFCTPGSSGAIHMVLKTQAGSVIEADLSAISAAQLSADITRQLALYADHLEDQLSKWVKSG